MFLPPPGIEKEERVTAYYTVMFVILAIGYAIIAISHNSMILKLAHSKSNQVLLASIKTSGTAIACIIIYVTAYFCLGGDEDKLGSNAFISFVMITSVSGAMTTVLFHLLVRETSQNQINEVSDCSLLSELKVQDTQNVNLGFVSNMTKTGWLKTLKFHVVIILYAISRTFYTACLTYLVFYVQYSLMLKRSYIAIIPLALVLIGLVLSKQIKQFIDFNGLENSMLFFCLMGGLTCTWIWFGCRNNQSKRYEIFGIAVCLGICSYSMMVISLSLVVALIGKNLGSSGFVYATMGFVDRLVVGVVLMVIQNFSPAIPKNLLQPIIYFRLVLAIFNGGLIFVASTLVSMLFFIGTKK